MEIGRDMDGAAASRLMQEIVDALADAVTHTILEPLRGVAERSRFRLDGCAPARQCACESCG